MIFYQNGGSYFAEQLPVIRTDFNNFLCILFLQGEVLVKRTKNGGKKGKKKKGLFLLLLPCWGKLYFVKIGFLYTMWHGPVDVLLYKDNVYTQYLCFFFLFFFVFSLINFFTPCIFFTLCFPAFTLIFIVCNQKGKKKIMMPAGLIWLELCACMCIVLLLAQQFKLARFA